MLRTFTIDHEWLDVARAHPEAFATEAERFYSRFTEVHPGYSKNPPGFYPVFLSAHVAPVVPTHRM